MSDDGFKGLMAEAVPNAGPGWAEIIKNSAVRFRRLLPPEHFQATEGRG